MKRMIVLLLSALFLTACLSGCAGSTTLSPKSPVTLSLWHVYGEQADSPMNRLVEEFNATKGRETGIVITVTNMTSSSAIPTQLQDALAKKPGALEAPDLFSCHTTVAVMLGAENLLDWKTQFSAEDLANYVPEFLADGTMNDRLAVFPVSKSTYALFLNGSQFARFSADTGVSYDDLATWDGFFDAAAKYYQWSGGKPFCSLDYLIRHVELDVLARGMELRYTDDGWYAQDSQALRDSWMMFAEPLAQGHIEVSDQYFSTQITTGVSLAGIGSTASIGYINEEVTYPDNSSEPTNLMVLPLPRSGDGQQYMPQTGVGLAAFATTAQKAEAAGVFVRWLTEAQRNLDFVVQTGYMPVNNDAFAAIDSYPFSSEGYANLYRAIQTMRQSYIPVVRPDFDGYYAKVDALYAGLRAMQADLSARAANGESPTALAEETWELFCSIR